MNHFDSIKSGLKVVATVFMVLTTVVAVSDYSLGAAFAETGSPQYSVNIANRPGS